MTEMAENLLLAGNVLAAFSLLLTSIARILRDRDFEQPVTGDANRRGTGQNYFDL